MSASDGRCNDALEQDGYRGRCRLEPGHEMPHEGLCFRAERSEIADLCWVSADEAESTPTARREEPRG